MSNELFKISTSYSPDAQAYIKECKHLGAKSERAADQDGYDGEWVAWFGNFEEEGETELEALSALMERCERKTFESCNWSRRLPICWKL